MPFRDENTSAFGPDDLDILTAAFNAAWEQLATTNSTIASEDQAELLKKRLATCILACATPGQLDRARLTEDGLKVFFDGVAWPPANGTLVSNPRLE
jgi:hypothetical protein